MLENFFLNQIRGLKQLVDFTIKKISAATKLKPITIGFTRLKWVDDVQQKSLLMNANANGKISDDTLISELGHNMTKEFEKMTDEIEKRGKIQKIQAKVQAEAEGESMITNMRYQMKAQVEQAKMQRDMSQEYAALGFSPEETQRLMASASMQQPGGGQFTPKGVLGKEPNRPGVSGAPAQTQVTNPDVWAGQFASTISEMDPVKREQLLAKLQMDNPQVHGLVQEKLMQGMGVDTRPNPQQKPPRRNAGPAPTPSTLQ